ncbi:hypothetical protein TGAM01_v209994 [Trichoderma gamsii]|uniref:Uncharacterized protein n=1 Tax=Trichoderma gamsii TaxID=398673 RepID=A0A2P4ZA59_9HYPO|nr:hypothetical protein TGAM01_v209994 [Trichoderma gamsii]PON21146.1 hypothetical protein TGAM01_v209994 [Trichoderma gamsii]
MGVDPAEISRAQMDDGVRYSQDRVKHNGARSRDALGPWHRDWNKQVNKGTKKAFSILLYTIHARGALSRVKLGRPLIRALDCVTGHKGQARPGQTRVRLTEMPHLPPCIWTTGRQRARGCSADVRWR